MKRKWLSQMIGCFLSAALVLGIAGCGNQNVQEGASNESGSEEKEEASKQQEPDSEEEDAQKGTEEISYPLVTDEILTVWDNNQLNPSSEYADYTESPFHTGLAEKTGVEVIWQEPAQGIYGIADNQAYNLLLTQEELPDIIFTSVTTAEAEQLISDGVIYDLTEYLPVYAPDYWEIINRPENADILQSLKTESGGFFSVGQFPEADYNVTYVGPVIRQDWLDECNLESPVTLEDWENVLTTFKERYGASFGFFISRLNICGIGSGTGAYATFKATFYVDDDGKVQFAQTQPEWKEYMEVLHRWYDMGLIDKDSVTMDDAALRTKVLNNEIGISYTAMSQLSNWVLDAENEGTGAEWVGLEYPRTAAGEPTCMIQTRASRYSGWGAMITTSCPEERLITALKWLNYGYTEDGIMYWNYGKEGVSYVIDDNGEVQWSELVTNDPMGTSEATRKYTGVAGTGMSIQLAHYVQIKNSQNAADAVYAWIENSEGPQHCLPSVAMTDAESVEYSDKMAAIVTRVQEMGLKYMTGDESLDHFDAFVEELDSMGLQECLNIVQAAYDRFMAK